GPEGTRLRRGSVGSQRLTRNRSEWNRLRGPPDGGPRLRIQSAVNAEVKSGAISDRVGGCRHAASTGTAEAWASSIARLSASAAAAVMETSSRVEDSKPSESGRAPVAMPKTGSAWKSLCVGCTEQ